jgi:hypothetical protein
LPKDKHLRAQLEKKLQEYEKRKSPENRQKNPESAIDACYKSALLGVVLKNRPVNTWDFSLALARQYGDGFNEELCDRACDVVAGYCKCNDGAELVGGTGLPQA